MVKLFFFLSLLIDLNRKKGGENAREEDDKEDGRKKEKDRINCYVPKQLPLPFFLTSQPSHFSGADLTNHMMKRPLYKWP